MRQLLALIIIAIGLKAIAQQPVVIQRKSVQEFSIPVGTNEIFPDKQTVVFKFFTSEQNQDLILSYTCQNVDLTDGIGNVTFTDQAGPDGQTAAQLFGYQALWYTTTITGRHESRKMKIALQSTSTPAAIPTTPTPRETTPSPLPPADNPFHNSTSKDALIIFDFSKHMKDSNGNEFATVSLDRGREFLGLNAGRSDQTGRSVQLVPGRKLRVNVVGYTGIPQLRLTAAAPSETQQTTLVTMTPDNNGDFYTYTDLSFAVPAAGTLKIEVISSGAALADAPRLGATSEVANAANARSLVKAQTAALPTTNSIVVVPAPLWNMQNAFTAEFVIANRGNPAFALATPVYTFTPEWRIDAVGLFSSGNKNDTSLGEALSFNTYLGSQYKTSGRHPIGFPVRLSLTAGIADWSFSDHKFGTQPFFGIGLTIPLGGQPADVANAKPSPAGG